MLGHQRVRRHYGVCHVIDHASLTYFMCGHILSPRKMAMANISTPPPLGSHNVVCTLAHRMFWLQGVDIKVPSCNLFFLFFSWTPLDSVAVVCYYYSLFISDCVLVCEPLFYALLSWYDLSYATRPIPQTRD